jgi:molecular chaperone Hsp33
MGALLKTGQRIALKFEGNGPLKKIVVEADSNGTVHGYVGVPDVYMLRGDGKLDVAGALGKAGFLTVTKDLGLKELYKGIVQLYTSEIAEDLAYYFTKSEQTPSAVALGVYVEPDSIVSAAGGFLIQSMPPHDEEMTDRLMERISRIASLTQLIREGSKPEDILEMLFEGVPYETIEKRSLSFQCPCNREKIERVLISLGRDELINMIEKQGDAEVRCEFCTELYPFSREELKRLLDGIISERRDRNLP